MQPLFTVTSAHIRCVRSFLPALPTKELQQLKAIINQQFPQYANSPSEFEELWKTCIIAVQQFCKRLRY